MFATLLAAALALHPISQSSSTISVRGAHVEVAIRCQAASVLEVLGSGADPNHDDLLSQAELDAARADFEPYLLEHYRISVGGSDAAQARRLTGKLAELRPDVIQPDTFGAQQWIAATLAFESDADVPDLLIEDRIFQEASPNHSDLCTVKFNDESPMEAKFWAGETLRYYKPKSGASAPAPTANRIRRADEPQPQASAPSTTASAPAGEFSAHVPLGEWIRLGVEHILTGWDHIAFVIGLLVAAGSLSALLGVITAFTLAHSITLALSALDVVHVPPAPVEVLIGASIAWVGLANLLQRGPVARWKEAFGFGLVHGLGFASVLRELLAGEPRRVLPLFGFNLGVEAGQLLVVAVLLALLFVGRRLLRRGAAASDGSPALAPRSVRRVASLGVAAAGIYLVVVRAAALF